jgi:hypothetical protein
MSEVESARSLHLRRRALGSGGIGRASAGAIGCGLDVESTRSGMRNESETIGVCARSALRALAQTQALAGARAPQAAGARDRRLRSERAEAVAPQGI